MDKQMNQVVRPIEFDESLTQTNGRSEGITNYSGYTCTNPIAPLAYDLSNYHNTMSPLSGCQVSGTELDKVYVEHLAHLAEQNNKYQNEQYLSSIRHQHAKELENLETDNRMKIEDKKHENLMKRIEGMEAMKSEYAHAIQAVIENADGYLCYETKYPNRESKFSKPILNCRNMVAQIICDIETHETIAVIISADDLKDRIILVKDEIDIKTFEKCLVNHGVDFRVSRDNRKQVLNLLLTYLLNNAVVVEFPSSVGWNKTKDGWLFAESKEKTVEGVIST